MVAGHFLVEAATRLGLRFGLSPTVVGLTIVAAGTSAPELAVVAQAVASGDSELAVGGIIGSNIANILLVLGTAAALGAIVVSSRVVRTDIPIMIAASVAMLVMSLDGSLGRADSALLFVGFAVFMWWTLRAVTTPGDVALDIVEPDAPSKERLRTEPLAAQIFQLVLGAVGLAIAARLVVSGASSIATSLGVSDLIIGLTVVAIGTSAPELVTSILAAVKGERDLAVGNAVGSNVFNILLVLGATGIFAPDGITVSDDALRLDLPVMVVTAVACLPIVARNHRLDRWEGFVFLGYYIAYLTFLALEATEHPAADPFAVIMIGFVVPLTLITGGIVISRQRRTATDTGSPATD